MIRPQRILITGAEGIVGSILRERLAARYTLEALTRTPQSFPSHVADIANLAAILPAFQGVDAVIHLAAAATLDSPWSDVMASNIAGTHNVFEAAREAGVKTVVYASSGHVLGLAEDEGAPEIYALGDRRTFDHTTPVRPDSLYAVSKVFGEALGRFYSDMHGMRVICVRLGSVRNNSDPGAVIDNRGRSARLPPEARQQRARAKWLSQRDCAELFSCCLDATDVRWAVVFGTSKNPRRLWSLDEAKTMLGYIPQDTAPERPGGADPA